jgi:hypothetical protein
MTGSGTFAAQDGTIISYGLQLGCDAKDPRQRLEVNWGNGNKFRLDTVTAVICYANPAIRSADPAAPFNTMVLTGIGKAKGNGNGKGNNGNGKGNNGNGAATISVVLTDAGGSGTNDTIQMTITDSDGNTIWNVPATSLTSGNQQAHRATGKQP